MVAARYAKFIAAALAAAGVIASSGLLSGDAQQWTNTVIAAIGAAMVLLVPNAQPLGDTGDAELGGDHGDDNPVA